MFVIKKCSFYIINLLIVCIFLKSKTVKVIWKPFYLPRAVLQIKDSNIYMSQDLTERTFWQQKSIVRYLQREKDLTIVNNYRKFEELIFTNNTAVSV